MKEGRMNEQFRKKGARERKKKNNVGEIDY